MIRILCSTVSGGNFRARNGGTSQRCGNGCQMNWNGGLDVPLRRTPSAQICSQETALFLSALRDEVARMSSRFSPLTLFRISPCANAGVILHNKLTMTPPMIPMTVDLMTTLTKSRSPPPPTLECVDSDKMCVVLDPNNSRLTRKGSRIHRVRPSMIRSINWRGP